jgi:hypothetical protein
MARKRRPTEEKAIPPGFTDEPIEAFKILLAAVVVAGGTAAWIQSHEAELGNWGADQASDALQNVEIMLLAILEQYESGLREMEVVPPEGIVWKEIRRPEELPGFGDDLPF